MSVTYADSIRPGTYLHFKHLLLKSGFLGFLYFLLPALVILLTRGRSGENYATVDSSNSVKILVILTMGIAIFLRLLNSHSFTLFVRRLSAVPLSWFIFYLSWAAVSLFWAPTLFYSAWMLFENIIYVAAILLIYIRFEENISDCVHFILYYGIYTYVLFFFQRFVLWGLPLTMHNLHGVGAIEAAPLLFLALHTPTRLWIKLAYLAITFIATPSSMFLSIAVVQVIACLTVRNRIIHILIVLSAATVIAGTRGAAIEKFIFFGKETSVEKKITGRDQMYEAVYKAARNKPMAGYGFCCLNVALNKAGDFGSGRNIPNAHNFVLEAFVCTGAIGALIMIFFFISVLWTSGITLRSSPLHEALFYSAITVMIVSFLNPSVSGRVYGAWEPTIFVVILTTHVLCLRESQNLLPEEPPFI